MLMDKKSVIKNIEGYKIAFVQCAISAKTLVKYR